jgi:hypothetical protein
MPFKKTKLGNVSKQENTACPNELPIVYGQSVEPLMVTLQRDPHTLSTLRVEGSVQGKPIADQEKVVVRLDGKEKGKAFEMWNDLEPRLNASVEVLADGYRSWQNEIPLRAGKTTLLRGELQRETRTIYRILPWTGYGLAAIALVVSAVLGNSAEKTKESFGENPSADKHERANLDSEWSKWLFIGGVSLAGGVAVYQFLQWFLEPESRFSCQIDGNDCGIRTESR